MKRIVAFVLTLTMLLAIVPFSALNVAAANFVTNGVDPYGNTGTEDDPYEIKTVEDWASYASSARYIAAGKYVVLANDLTFNETGAFIYASADDADDVAANYIPGMIKGYNTSYVAEDGSTKTTVVSVPAGGGGWIVSNFDGQGHTINGLIINTANAGAFLGFDGTAFLKDVVFENCFINSTSTSGRAGIVGAVNGSDTKNISGIVVKPSCTIMGCSYSVAGILGYINAGTVNIEKCVFNGKIYNTGTRTAGIALSRSSGTISMNNVYFGGDIVTTASTDYTQSMDFGTVISTTANAFSNGHNTTPNLGTNNRVYTTLFGHNAANTPSTIDSIDNIYYMTGEGCTAYTGHYNRNLTNDTKFHAITEESTEVAYSLNTTGGTTENSGVWGFDGTNIVFADETIKPTYKVTFVNEDTSETLVSYTDISGKTPEYPVAEGNNAIKVDGMTYDCENAVYTADTVINYRIESSSNYYDFAVSNDGNGEAVVDKTRAEENATVTFTATPNHGYAFDKWVDANNEATVVSSENPYIVTATENLSLKAVFAALPTYEIIVNIDNESHGTVSKDATCYHAGDEVTITATEAVGARFEYWTNNLNDEKVYDAVYKFAVTGDVTYTAHYREVTEHIAFAAANGEGTVTINGENVSELGVVEGETVTFAAVANSGYRLAHWKDSNGNILGFDTTLALVMGNGNITVTAYFVEDTNNSWYNTADGTDCYGNTGTAEDPFEIKTVGDWEGFALRAKAGHDVFLDKYIVLVNNLVFNDSAVFNYAEVNDVNGYIEGMIIGYKDGARLSPTVGSGKQFKGNFDGQGHTISGIIINPETTTDCAIFNFLYNATIKNLIVKDAFVSTLTTAADAGTLSRVAVDSTFENIAIKGASTVILNSTSSYKIGGIVGTVQTGNNSTFDNCVFSGYAFGNGTRIFAIAFLYNVDATISNCLFDGHIKTTLASTSRAGLINRGIITNCAVTGDMEAQYKTFITDINNASSTNLLYLNSKLTNHYGAGSNVTGGAYEGFDAFDDSTAERLNTTNGTTADSGIWVFVNGTVALKMFAPAPIATTVEITGTNINLVNSALSIIANAKITGEYAIAGFEICPLDDATGFEREVAYEHTVIDGKTVKFIEFTAEQLGSSTQYYVSLNNIGIVSAVNGFVIFPYYVESGSDVKVYGKGVYENFYTPAKSLVDDPNSPVPALQSIINVCDLVVLGNEATYAIEDGTYTAIDEPSLDTIESGITVKANLNYGAANGGFMLIANVTLPAGVGATAIEKGVYFVKVSDLGTATTVEEAVANGKAVKLVCPEGTSDTFYGRVSNLGLATAKTGFVAVAYYNDGTGTVYSNACNLNYYNMMLKLFNNYPAHKAVANNILAACNVVL